MRAKSPGPSLLPAGWLVRQRVHDYSSLTKRWRRVARAAGTKCEVFARAGEHEIFYLKSRAMAATARGVYVSAGIHGDEPAGTEALITWAEQNVELLRHRPFLLFPCLNPWGLIHNSRFDEEKQDLNRVFHHNKIEMIRNLKALIRPCRFALALTLHEDYDGQGLYIYEPERAKPFWGEDLLRIAQPIIPIEGRLRIEGRKARAGLLRRSINLKKFPLVPEAIYLHRRHSDRTFTFETPSEFALDLRVLTHIALLSECVRRTFPIG